MTNMPATIFLFGAGASYGSDIQGTPPLGDCLFEELRRFNPDAWGRISGNLATTFRSDFEQGMSAVSTHALTQLQRAMAAYFYSFQPRTSNLYYELARRFAGSSGWSGAACTLNYDRLLELSLSRAGLRPFVGQAPPGEPAFELCFPHGCCHIFCDAIKGIAGHVSMNGFAVQTNGPVSVISDPAQHRARILGDAFPPVMSYFEPSKRTTAGRSFIEGQRMRWQELAANAKLIIIVGLRVRTEDNHVWVPISESSAQVVYCGGSRGGAEYEVWSRATRAGRGDKILPGYFRDEFSAICAEAGL